MINCTQLSNTEMTPFFFIVISITYPFLIPFTSIVLINRGNERYRLIFSEILKFMSFRNLVDYGNFLRLNCDIESSCRFSIFHFIGESLFMFYFCLYPNFVNKWDKYTKNERLAIVLTPFILGIYLVTVISYNCYAEH